MPVGQVVWDVGTLSRGRPEGKGLGEPIRPDRFDGTLRGATSAFADRRPPPAVTLVGVNLEKVIFGFFVLLAATLNFGFFIGDLGDPHLHNVYELFAAVVVNLIATVLKFGDRTQIGAVHMATSLVADIQLIAASVVYVYGTQWRRPGSTGSSRRAWSRCPAGPCSPTSSRWCSWSSRPSPTGGADRRPTCRVP